MDDRAELRVLNEVLEHGGGPRIAEALRQYWTVAIEPFWPQIRAVLDVSVLPALLPPGPPEQE